MQRTRRGPCSFSLFPGQIARLEIQRKTRYDVVPCLGRSFYINRGCITSLSTHTSSSLLRTHDFRRSRRSLIGNGAGRLHIEMCQLVCFESDAIPVKFGVLRSITFFFVERGWKLPLHDDFGNWTRSNVGSQIQGVTEDHCSSKIQIADAR